MEILSCSRIRTKLRCGYLYRLIYIEGKRPQPTKALLYGVEKHKQLELYANHKPCRLSKREKALVDRLKGLCLGWPITEFHLVFEALGHKFQMIADLLHPFGSAVYDYKTTKSLDFAKQSWEVAGDLQANLYTLGICGYFRRSKMFFSFEYLPKNGEPFLSSGDHIRKKDAKDFVEKTLGLYNAQSTDKIEDFGSRKCYLFGGCPFLDLCRSKLIDKLY